MHGVFLWIAGLIVAVLAALFGVPYAVDWNSYRGVFEEEASRMLGREVRVGGDVSLRLLPVPYVKFGKPRIADAEVGDAFFRAESFTMWLALPPLLQGIFEAKQVELERPVLKLQLHEDGGGNWNTFTIRQGALPFVPRGIALQSVRISEGVLAVHGPDGRPLTRIVIADGELSAPALEGPYRIRADVHWNGETREVRASTAAPAADGSTRIKVTVRSPHSGKSYVLDGDVRDFTGRPQFEGSFTALLPTKTDLNELRPTTVEAEQAGSNEPLNSAFEVRAQVSANAVSAKLSDVAFSFEQEGQPQLMTGMAEASWKDQLVVKSSLSSRWLDLDRIAGVEAGTNALEAMRRLSSSVMDLIPTDAEVATSITIDQANLAGDVVSGLVMAVENSGSGLEIKELRAALPGGTRLDVTGSLSGSGTAEAFEGDILLRGASFSRFVEWAARGSGLSETRSNTGFAVSGHLKLSDDGLELSKATVDTGPNHLKGDLTYYWSNQKRLSLSLETEYADLSALLPGALAPELLGQAIEALTSEQNNSSAAGLLAELAGADVRIRVRADSLSDGIRMLQNVDADLNLENGRLRIPRLTASSPKGFNIELDGDVRSVAEKANGALRGVIEAKTAEALTEALQIGLATLGADERRRLASLAPLRLAFVSHFGASDGKGAEITIDGIAQGQPLKAALQFDDGLANWRTKPADIYLVADSTEVLQVLRGLLFGGGDSGGAPMEGRVVLKAAGVPAEDTLVYLQASGSGLQLTMNARGAWPENAAPKFAGNIDVRAKDASHALTLAGLTLPERAVDGPLNGKLAIAAADDQLTFRLDQLEVGSARLTGTVALSGLTAGDRKLNVELQTDTVSLPHLLSFALAPDVDGTPVAELSDGSQWPDRPFDFSNLEDLNGHLKLQAKTLELGQGFGLSDAQIEAEIAPGRLSITKLEGQALGGAVSGAFKLEKTTAGAQTSGAFGLWDIRLDRIKGASGAPVGTGQLRLSAEFQGQAITPRALIPVLTGRGELELKSVRWERLAPGAVEVAADTVLSGQTAPTGEPLRQALRSALASKPLMLGNQKLAIEIDAGALKIAAFSVETPEANVVNQTTVDLADLKIDSEWKLEPKATRGSTTPLPGISVAYVGPLKSIASLEPQLFIDALERELAVRGMERDVEHLERLRREDEERARAKAERLRKLEEERQRQIEALRGMGAQGLTIDVPFPLPTQTPATSPSQQNFFEAPQPTPPPRNVPPRPSEPLPWDLPSRS